MRETILTIGPANIASIGVILAFWLVIFALVGSFLRQRASMGA